MKQLEDFREVFDFISKERKVGGAVEVDMLTLKSNEVFHNAVITNVDVISSNSYFFSIMTEQGKNIMINATEIFSISPMIHKCLCQISNTCYRETAILSKKKYLKRLCEVNENSNPRFFIEELRLILNDIGESPLASQILFR